jgi:hypothetical protein
MPDTVAMSVTGVPVMAGFAEAKQFTLGAVDRRNVATACVCPFTVRVRGLLLNVNVLNAVKTVQWSNTYPLMGAA